MSFFGTNIKRIRQVKGLSQKAFADLFDLNRGVISSYEEGRAEPKIETILKVASHFNLDLDKLLSETLQSNQLNKVSDTDQLLLFPEFAPPKEIKTLSGDHSSNNSILQKILASVDLIFEFTEEKQLLPQYHYGDVLFLNKADLKKDPIHSLLIYVDENLEYASNTTDGEHCYKIVGHISTSEKNIFTEIFERLERLEKTR
ncbi:XRE family transcriptional regulator [Chryseobacterium sp. G0186]|uniref:helix-turn-helix domain-containing protein n=1 Tax=Chryseobacterium sp. G0186 TaxID=2487064 RepID=UPI000F50E89D|nr:helix-turn-helix transcriptional regulator [Chryseobacterium sp. G0186]AZA78543.1 XRE family transcriptional regulator [Chryseobacterium sp. G0186]